MKNKHDTQRLKTAAAKIVAEAKVSAETAAAVSAVKGERVMGSEEIAG